MVKLLFQELSCYRYTISSSWFNNLPSCHCYSKPSSYYYGNLPDNHYRKSYIIALHIISTKLRLLLNSKNSTSPFFSKRDCCGIPQTQAGKGGRGQRAWNFILPCNSSEDLRLFFKRVAAAVSEVKGRPCFNRRSRKPPCLVSVGGKEKITLLHHRAEKENNPGVTTCRRFSQYQQ